MAEPVRWGVLSTAHFAVNRWLPAFVQAPDVEGVAIASREKEKADEIARQFGFRKAYGSYDELLADPEIEAVYIPLPNGLHGEWAIKAARAGKHVLVEKPGAPDVKTARQMAAAARSAGVRLMEAFMIRHHERWRRLRALVAEGYIGTPRLLQGSFCFTLDDPGNFRFYPELAGGALADVGCYPVNAARFAFGEEPTHAWGSARDRRGTGVDTTFSGGLQFPTADAAFVCSFETGYQQALTLFGSEGTLTLNRPFICRDEPVVLSVYDRKGNTHDERIPVGNQYVDSIAHFGTCVRDPEKPLWPGEDGVASACALDALHRSARTGRMEAVEPA